MTGTVETPRHRRVAAPILLRARALLAGGLMLGVGAAVTLAGWTGSENLAGSFTSGAMGIESSLDGGASWTSHPSAGSPGSLAFTLGGSALDTLAPGDVVYAPLELRLTGGSTADASVTLTAGGSTGSLLAGLTYAITAVGAGGCSAATPPSGAALVPSGTAITSVPAGTGFTLAHNGSDSWQPGAAASYCVVVTAGPGIAAGATGTASWVFTATAS